jgi:malonyl-CoA decarboxylase
VGLREKLLGQLRKSPELQAVDADLHHLLSSWFNPGFLRLEQLSWDSPAGLLEQIIAHEAVHEIEGWTDLQRRLQPDRRLFAYFHPALPREPLIFVEVAFSEEMPGAIAPLLDRKRVAEADPGKFRVATFYSISNCQPGLKGVHLGNFLIKRVAEKLQSEFPKIKTFCTLSPVPSLVQWLLAEKPLPAGSLTPARLKALEMERAELRLQLNQRQSSAAGLLSMAEDPALGPRLKSLCAAYLSSTAAADERHSDPVARFHLNNGARLERINPLANLTAKGVRQSLGLMVNYLYDLDEVEENHERFVRGEATASRGVLRAV